MNADAPVLPSVSVLIAAYNEAATVAAVIANVANTLPGAEIVVVDDGSHDATIAEVERAAAQDGLAVKLLRHETNRGKGAAIRTAIGASTGEVVVIQDADLEYDPRDIPKLLAPIVEGHADVVYGTRLRGGEPQRVHLFWHYAGNRFLSLLTNVLYNTTLSDMEVGYKAFQGDLIRSVPLSSNGFDFEPEVTAKLLRRGVRMYELPISYYGRSYEEGKKITWRDGVAAVRTLLRFRFGG